ADGHQWDRLLRHPRPAHVRAERGHRQAGLDVPGRQVLAGRRRPEAALPRRLHPRLRDGAEAVRYLVTGAAGFIGSHLSEALAASGHDVDRVDAFTDYYDPARKEENARGLDV